MFITYFLLTSDISQLVHSVTFLYEKSFKEFFVSKETLLNKQTKNLLPLNRNFFSKNERVNFIDQISCCILNKFGMVLRKMASLSISLYFKTKNETRPTILEHKILLKSRKFNLIEETAPRKLDQVTTNFASAH